MRLICFLLAVVISIQLDAQSKTSAAESAYEIARSHYRKKEFGLAYEAIEQSLSYQQTADAYYLQGLIHEAEGRELRAVASYEGSLQLEPNFREARFQKGILYLKNGDPEQAILDFSELLKSNDMGTTRGVYFEVDPRNNQAAGLLTLEGAKSRLYYYRGMAYQCIGNKDAALRDFEEALALTEKPDFLNARALLYESIGNETMALNDLRRATQLDTLHALSWFNLVRLDEHVKLPQTLLEGGDGATVSLLAARAHERGDYEEALKLYNVALENNKDALTLLNRGRILSKLKHYGKARMDFKEARKADASLIESLYLIGNTYFLENEFDQALAYYNEYLSVNPTDANTWYNGALCQLKLANEVEACHYLSRATTLGMSQAASIRQSRCEEE